MNPILADMYATVAPSAPFIIAAFAIVWLALLAYVVFVLRGLKKTEAQMALLEEALAARTGASGGE
jgi:CcmD family protein